jgi:DNA-binding transcriptional LysR family regulator
VTVVSHCVCELLGQQRLRNHRASFTKAQKTNPHSTSLSRSNQAQFRQYHKAMELRQLRYFLAVAEELHFTRAAERLYVAQPALSLQIRQLEEELGVKLFERLKHRVQLTPAGRVFAQRARFALEQTQKAAKKAALVGRGEAGSFSIGFVSSAVVSVLPGILRSYSSQIPAVTIELLELDPSEQLEGLRNGTLDLGVMHALVETPDLEMATLVREELLAALPASHPAAQDKQVDLAMLAEETFLVPKRHEFGGLHEVVIDACHKAGLVPRKIQATRLLQTALCLVGGGLGVALVPESFRENVQIKGLAYRPLASKLVVDLVAVWLNGNESLLLERLREYFPKALATSDPV